MKLRQWVGSNGYLSDWQTRFLPGLLAMVLVLSARGFGLLEPLELIVFDYLMKLRPREEPDLRITLVKITQSDVQRWGGYPIATQRIAELVETLQVYHPAVIGLNILEDIVSEDKQPLVALFQTNQNLVIAEKVIQPQIKAPKEIDEKNIGFVDISSDRDQHLRRIWLGVTNPVNLAEFKFSFSIRLAEKYLLNHRYTLENGLKNTNAMRFGKTEIPVIDKNFGAYVGIDSGGIQTLINYRNNPSPFQVLPIHVIETGRISPDLVRDRIIIIGIVDPAARSPITTIVPPISGALISGVELQGHATSQIVSAVLDNRTLFKNWDDSLEYLWIIFGGLLSFIGHKKTIQYRLKEIVILGFGISTITYVFVLNGYMIPFLPVILTLMINTCIVQINNIKEKEVCKEKQKEEIRKESNERKKIIERTFSIIHNGPLQTLSSIIRDTQSKNEECIEIINNLKSLDDEIRQIGDFLKEEKHKFSYQFYLGNKEKLDLRIPMHEIFYALFSKTVARDLIGFKSLKIKLRSFDPIDERLLTIELKRELCLFLEGMLCNVEKHAKNASQLIVIGRLNNKTYSLMIQDNGLEPTILREGEGTKQAKRLAAQIRGHFSRRRIDLHGLCCEMTWPIIDSVS